MGGWKTRTRDLSSNFGIYGAVAVRVQVVFYVDNYPPADHRHILWVPEHHWTPKINICSTPNMHRAERWRKWFRCINRWCSEKPKKTHPKLTTSASVDHAETDILCCPYDRQQRKREFSIVDGVFQKLCMLPNIWKMQILWFLNIIKHSAEIGDLPPFAAQEDIHWFVWNADSKRYSD